MTKEQNKNKCIICPKSTYQLKIMPVFGCPSGHCWFRTWKLYQTSQALSRQGSSTTFCTNKQETCDGRYREANKHFEGATEFWSWRCTRQHIKSPGQHWPIQEWDTKEDSVQKEPCRSTSGVCQKAWHMALVLIGGMWKRFRSQMRPT